MNCPPFRYYVVTGVAYTISTHIGMESGGSWGKESTQSKLNRAKWHQFVTFSAIHVYITQLYHIKQVCTHVSFMVSTSPANDVVNYSWMALCVNVTMLTLLWCKSIAVKALHTYKTPPQSYHYH